MSKRRIPFSTLALAVGGVLRKERRSRNLTQHDVAEAVGVKQAHWSKIERGLTALNVRQLALAAGMLGIRPSDVICAAEADIMWQLARGHGV